MKAPLVKLAATMLILFLGGSAYGVTVITPLLESQTGACIECRSVNVSTAAVSVFTELVRSTGVVNGSFTCALAPGTDGPACAVGSCTAGLRAYCRFTFSAAKSKIRAAGYIFNGTVVPVIVPAQ